MDQRCPHCAESKKQAEHLAQVQELHKECMEELAKEQPVKEPTLAQALQETINVQAELIKALQAEVERLKQSQIYIGSPAPYQPPNPIVGPGTPWTPYIGSHYAPGTTPNPPYPPGTWITTCTPGAMGHGQSNGSCGSLTATG